MVTVLRELRQLVPVVFHPGLALTSTRVRMLDAKGVDVLHNRLPAPPPSRNLDSRVISCV